VNGRYVPTGANSRLADNSGYNKSFNNGFNGFNNTNLQNSQVNHLNGFAKSDFGKQNGQNLTNNIGNNNGNNIGNNIGNSINNSSSNNVVPVGSNNNFNGRFIVFMGFI
jgi:hypothetical protein